MKTEDERRTLYHWLKHKLASNTNHAYPTSFWTNVFLIVIKKSSIYNCINLLDEMFIISTVSYQIEELRKFCIRSLQKEEWGELELSYVVLPELWVWLVSHIENKSILATELMLHGLDITNSISYTVIWCDL